MPRCQTFGFRAAAGLWLLGWASAAAAAVLEVGPGARYANIESAMAAAAPGDEIRVRPAASGAYAGVALRLTTPNLTIRSVRLADGPRVRLNGEGYDYSGVGAIPRAIVQFEPSAKGCVLEGFELSGARNGTYNGAGVRINGANDIVVRDCEMHDNDMGIMSSGGAAGGGENQLIEECLIRDNGTGKQPGQNHNLYLGGTSVTLSACEVRRSITGHNVKSRAHHTRVEYSYIHDAANREFDLVDSAGETDIPNSDAVLIGNVIVKANPCRGNRLVINFGQDGGNDHTGTAYLVHNTIVTPYIAPVIELSAPGARARLMNNIIWDAAADQHNQHVAGLAAGALNDPATAAAEVNRRVSGANNWFSAHFAEAGGIGFLSEQSTVAAPHAILPFTRPEAGDFRLRAKDAAIVNAGLSWAQIKLPTPPGADAGKRRFEKLWEPVIPLRKRLRSADGAADIGAYAYSASDSAK